MAKWESKEAMLDDFFDHLFPEGGDEPTDDDRLWFDHAAKFFDFDESGNEGGGEQNPPRRRRGTPASSEGKKPPSAPRRQRRTPANTGGEYGSSKWFNT